VLVSPSKKKDSQERASPPSSSSPQSLKSRLSHGRRVQVLILFSDMLLETKPKVAKSKARDHSAKMAPSLAHVFLLLAL